MSRIVTVGRELVVPLLMAVHSAADALGPLKMPAGGALLILELAQRFKANRREWIAFGQYVTDMLAGVVYILPEIKEQPDVILTSLEGLASTLDEIRRDIESIQKQSKTRRVISFFKDAEKILNMRRSLDDALKFYLVNQSISTGIDVQKLFGSIDAHVASIQVKISSVEDNIVKHVKSALKEVSVLHLLPYAKEASWNPDRVCLPPTRQTLLEDIWAWIHDPKSSRMFWISGVAGSGKTAVAHTVAQRCAHSSSSIILSAFFFTLDKPDRNSQLISTIVTDLLKISDAFTAMIASAIEADRSLVSAPISRQFEELLLNPSRSHPPSQPVVIIIDALDEGYSEDLLKLLRTQIHLLPEMFRIILTSRSDIKIDSFLSGSKSIHKCYMDLDTNMNTEDIMLYSKHRFDEVASLRQLRDGWLKEGFLKDFAKMAEGLFLWVTTVINFIQFMMDPEEELYNLVYNSDSRVSAEDKMSTLYSAILERCNWRDRKFAESYTTLIGEILAAKTPLSISAWQSIHKDVLQVSIRDVLLSAGSLFAGLNQKNVPIRILHQSFRDFSCSPPALPAPPFSSYYTNINVSKHSERLAHLCLATLNKCLAQDIPRLGYLEARSGEPGIPSIPPEMVPEELWYASSYWMDHLLDVGTPTLAFLQMLQEFLQQHLVAWMELSAMNGTFRNLRALRAWHKTQESVSLEPSIMFLSPNRCAKIQILASRLSELNRREDALTAMEEVVLAYRELAQRDPIGFNPDLAESLHFLAKLHYNIGQWNEAQEASHEAVLLRRVLVAGDPKKFASPLAKSLQNRALYLYDLGRTEEAVEVVQESIKLHQGLPGGQPNEFNDAFAHALHDLSVYLSLLGRREEAVEIAQKVITLYRAHEGEHSKPSDPGFAWTLQSFSLYLSDLGRIEEALEAVQESVTIRRVLAAENPKTYNRGLAESLHGLATYMSRVGQTDEALNAERDSVSIGRVLANEYPRKFNSTLADSLRGLSWHLHNLGRNKEALEAIEESVILFRGLVDEQPKKFNSDLASSLHNLAIYLSDLDRAEEAMETFKETLTLRRALANEFPKKYQSHLAWSLYSFSVYLSNLGRKDAAMEVARESLTIRRALANEYPKKFNSPLALSLHHLSTDLSDVGQRDEALSTAYEAVDLLQPLADELPAAYASQLQDSKDHLARLLNSS